MAPDPNADDRIELPTDFSNLLVEVGNVESAPRTMSELVAMFTDRLSVNDEVITPGDLYTDTPTRHEVQIGSRIRYSPCVLDALAAAVMEPEQPVTVRSIDPVTNRSVTFTVTEDSISIDPEEAMISFGLAPSIPSLESDESVFNWVLRDDSEGVEDAFCQYINAFESAESYEEWQGDTDAKTFPIRPDELYSLIGQYADRA